MRPGSAERRLRPKSGGSGKSSRKRGGGKSNSRSCIRWRGVSRGTKDRWGQVILLGAVGLGVRRSGKLIRVLDLLLGIFLISMVVMEIS